MRQTILPGLLLCAATALLATALQYLPTWPFTLANGHHPFEAVMLSILLGILINSLIKLNVTLNAGINFTSKKILYLAIILLASSLNIQMIRQLSTPTLLIILLSILVGLLVPLCIYKKLKVKQKTAILIAVGTAICGSAAIAAAAPIIEAEKEQIAISITAINLLGLLAIFIFPLLGHALQLSPTQLGIWTGSSIQAVAQVVAASFSYSHSAGLIGTLVKLVRVLFLAPTIIGLNIWQKHLQKKTSHHIVKNNLTTYIPPFIILFFIMLMLNSYGLFSNFTLYGMVISPHMLLKISSQFFMAMALAAIGLNTSLKTLLKASQPLLLAILAALFIWLFSLLSIHWLIT